MKQFILELGKGDFLHIDDEFTVKVGNKNKRIDMVCGGSLRYAEVFVDLLS